MTSLFVAIPAGMIFAACEPAPDAAPCENPPPPAQHAQPVAPEKNCGDAPVFADDELPPPPPPGAFSKEEARLLKSLFTMSETELRRLREFIQHLEKMPPERRRQMAEDLDRASSDMTPEQRKAYLKDVRARFRKNQENLLARYYSTLAPEQANAERKKFLAMNPRERRAYLSEVRKKLGYAPLPPPRERGEKLRHEDENSGEENSD